MNLSIGSKKNTNPSFELVISVRDINGNPTNKRKSYTTDDSVKLHSFWVRNTGSPKKKRKHKKAASTNKEIDVALQEVEQYTKMIRRKRKLED